MGGKSLVWAVAMVFALSMPAYAQGQKKAYAEKETGQKSDKVLVKKNDKKGKVARRATIGGEVFAQTAETSTITNDYRIDTTKTYECTWLETVTKTRTWSETYETGRSWVYPCPGAGYWRISYGTRTLSENYNVDEPRSETVSRTTSAFKSETLPTTTGEYSRGSRIGSSAITASAGEAGVGGARDTGFSGDTGAGAAGARSASAGKGKKIAGATKAIKTFGAKAFDLSGDWSGGLSLNNTSGDNYDFALGALKTEAKLNRGKGTLTAGAGKKLLVDLTIGDGGNSLTGTVRGEAKTFSRTSK